MITHSKYEGDCLEVVKEFNCKIDCVIADPPYDDYDLINKAIPLCRKKCSGASFFFMYAEGVYHLEHEPDQIIFWVKAASTKNTVRKYSRFVEVICCYDLKKSPFNQDTHWSTRSGVFFDNLIYTPEHPHAKPGALIEKLLAVNAWPGSIVLDPFAGSETVRKVCERVGMSSISVELNK